MIQRSNTSISVLTVLMAGLALSSCTGDPVGDVTTTLNIFMPDTSSMNVSRFRKETAPEPNVGLRYSDGGRLKKLPMRPQSTRLANAYAEPPLYNDAPLSDEDIYPPPLK